MIRPESDHKLLFVYAITGGLGDYLVFGDLIRKAEKMILGSRCVVIHRGNGYVNLWHEGNPEERFFDLYSLRELARFVTVLRRSRKEGIKIYCFQMAPGSVQGFVFYALLKRLDLIDFIVDFNLINADIITPPMGEYILDLHLNQLATLFQGTQRFHRTKLELPLHQVVPFQPSSALVGIHPWTRRNNERLRWPWEYWIGVIGHLLESGYTPLLFGRDEQYSHFQDLLEQRFGRGRVLCTPSSSVGELVETVCRLSLLVSLNSSVIHIAYAMGVKTVVLSGPHLPFWTPAGELIREVRDPDALYPPSDESKSDSGMPMVSRIPVAAVLSVVDELLGTEQKGSS